MLASSESAGSTECGTIVETDMTIQEMRAQYERQDYKKVSDYDLIAMYESAVSQATEAGDICIMLYNTHGYTDDSTLRP